MLTGRERNIISNSIQWTVIIAFAMTVILPLLYAIMRLESVTETNSLDSIFSFFSLTEAKEALICTIGINILGNSNTYYWLAFSMATWKI